MAEVRAGQADREDAPLSWAEHRAADSATESGPGVHLVAGDQAQTIGDRADAGLRRPDDRGRQSVRSHDHVEAAGSDGVEVEDDLTDQAGQRPRLAVGAVDDGWQELGEEVPEDVEVRVWDSTAETRFLVLPMRPAGTEGMKEDELAALVSRDAMIGVATVPAPAGGLKRALNSSSAWVSEAAGGTGILGLRGWVRGGLAPGR